MSRNRRNIRRNKNIKIFLNLRNFLIIISVLVIIIVVSLGINIYRINQDRKIIMAQQEEIRNQSQQIFSQIDNNIEQANQNISESDSIIKLSAVGDILCSNAMLEDAYDEKNNTYDFSQMFNNITNFVSGSDIVMGTMETGVTKGEYNDKNAPIEFAEEVKKSGINLVTVAHNHSLDNGVDGLEETEENLEKLGFDVIGNKENDSNDSKDSNNSNNSNTVIIKEIKNSKIAFLTYTCFLDNEENLNEEDIENVNMYSEEQAKYDIEYAKNEGAEYICVMIHWGDAISDKISDEQRKIADFLVDNDVDLIVGAHPSVVQPMEVRQNKDGENVFIAYSIGTYISTLSAEEARTELILNIELRKSGKDGKIYLNKVDYTPIYMLDNGENTENRFELIDMKSVATLYKGDETDKITRETYDNLVEGINRLNEILEISTDNEE